MGLFGGSDKGLGEAKMMAEQNRRLYNAIDLPEYDEMVPELFNSETAQYDLTEEDPALRSMQLDQLAKLGDLSETGLSDVDQAGFMKARAMGDQMAKSGTDAAINDAQVRGVGGGGQEFAMREAAQQAGAQRAQEAALAQQATAAQQRQSYLQAYANQTSNVRGQDHSANSANTDIVNRFNQANTQSRNATNAANVTQRQGAFEYNEANKDKSYQNQVGRADRIAGINTQQGEMSAAEAEAKRRRQQAAVGAVGAIAGGAIGGPAGAAAGSQAGNLL